MMYPLHINDIRAIARELNLTEIQYDPSHNLIAFSGGPSRAKRINVWYSTGTVGTYIDHPRQGKTQLFRRDVDLASLRKIFANPRLHTGIGYKTRRERASRSQSRSRSLSNDSMGSGILHHVNTRRGRSRSTTRRGATSRHNRIYEDDESSVGSWASVVKSRRKAKQIRDVNRNRHSYKYDDDASSVGSFVSIQSSHRARRRYNTNYDDDADSIGSCLASIRSMRRGATNRHSSVCEEDASSVGSWCGRSMVSAGSSCYNMNSFVTEEDAAKKQKRWLKKEMASLKREMEIVQGILDNCKLQGRDEVRRRKKALKQAVTKGKQGDKFMIFLSASQAPCITDQLGPKTQCVALGGSGESEVVVLNGGHRYEHTDGVPKKIVNLLAKRPDHSSPPVYISLGTMDRYYFEVENGKAWWNGPDPMEDRISRERRGVKSVAFGMGFGTYFIVWDDGDYTWGGKIPAGLKDILHRRRQKQDLVCVSLGPRGEYFMSCKNGRIWWDGMRKDAIDRISTVEDNVTFMDFGSDDTYIVRHS